MVRCRSSRRCGFIRRKTLVGLALLLIFGSLAVWRQSVYIQNMAPYRPYLTSSLIPGERSAERVTHLSFGYDDLFSALLWLRTIQDFGGGFRDPFALEALGNAFFAITALDPLFTDAYDFGSLVIADEGSNVGEWMKRTPEYGDATAGFRMVSGPEEARERAGAMLDTALRLFDYGISHDPDHYRHPYNATYSAMMGYRDAELGVPYAEVATTRFDCPEWVEGTIAYLQGRSGQYRVAISRWFAQMRQAISNQEALQTNIALRKISEDGVPPWNEEILDGALALWSAFNDGALPTHVNLLAQDGMLVFHPADVRESIFLWRQAHGLEGTDEMPPSIQTLVSEGHLPADPENPVEPLAFFDYRAFLIETDRLIDQVEPYTEIPESAFGLETFLTITGRVPEAPISLWCIRNSDTTLIRRQQMVGGFRYEIDRVAVNVRDTASLYRKTARELYDIRLRLDSWEAEFGGWPANLEQMFSFQNAEMPLEPTTGEPYPYDPATGIARSARFPMAAEIVFEPLERVGIEVLGVPDAPI